MNELKAGKLSTAHKEGICFTANDTSYNVNEDEDLFYIKHDADAHIASLEAEIDTQKTAVKTMAEELEELRKRKVAWDNDKARIIELEAKNEELMNEIESTNSLKDFCSTNQNKIVRRVLSYVLGIAATYQSRYFRIEGQNTLGKLVKRKERQAQRLFEKAAEEA